MCVSVHGKTGTSSRSPPYEASGDDDHHTTTTMTMMMGLGQIQHYTGRCVDVVDLHRLATHEGNFLSMSDFHTNFWILMGMGMGMEMQM